MHRFNWPNDGPVLKGEAMVNEKTLSGTLMFIGLLLVVSAFMSGCSSATGWRVSFGVAPVSQIRDVASLQGNQSDARIIKRTPAPKTGQTADDDY